MSSRSRVLVVLALALALTGAACGAVGPASAASPVPVPTVNPVDSVTIGSAGFTQNATQLSITANSTAPLASMKAHLYDSTTSDHVLDLIMQPPPGGAAAGASTWTAAVSEGAAPGGLPLGTYSVTVDITFQDGTVNPPGLSAGTVAFQEAPSVTLKVNPALSYGNQHPAISGTVTVLAPGAAAATPYAGEQVTLEDSQLGSVPLTTNASGGYSYTFAAPRAGETFSVQVPQTSAIAAAQSATETFTTHNDKVRMAASLSAATVTYGGKVTVKGTVSYAPGTAKFVPLPRQSVRIYDRPGSMSPVASAVTDGKGNFAVTLPKEATSVHWVLRAGGPYLNTATSTLPMKVNLPTVVTGFTAALNQLWQVSFRGCLGLRAGVPGYVPSLTGLTIQYAARPNGPWHKLGTVARQASFVCGNDGRTFSATLPAQLNYAYYRAVYAGGTDQTGTGYLPSASGTALAWKYEDRITSFAVSKRTVTKGGKLTVSGRLQYYSGKWRNYPGQQVLIILRPQGSKSWYWIAITETNAAGQFSATFTDPVSATWSAEYRGNSTHLDTAGGAVYVQLTT